MKFIVSKDDNSDILGDFLYVDYVLSVQTLYLYIKNVLWEIDMY